MESLLNANNEAGLEKHAEKTWVEVHASSPQNKEVVKKLQLLNSRIMWEISYILER
jgi:hypothetical protein